MLVKGIEAVLQKFSIRNLAELTKTLLLEVRNIVMSCRKKNLGLLIECGDNANNREWGSTDMNDRG